MRYGFDQFLNARSAYGPTVDAAGDRLYFISDIAGAPQLWSLPTDDPYAWPEPLAVGFDRVHAGYPSSRPGRLVFGADVGGNERTQLYLLDRPGGLARPLTDAPEVIHAFGDWAPDGREIAFASNARDPRSFDVYTLDVETGARRSVFRADGTHYAGRFSPDGRSLLVLRVDAPFDQTVFVVDLATGVATPLTERDRPTRYGHLAWSPDGRSVYCTTDRDREFLMLGAIDLASRQLAPVVVADWDVDDFALSPDGRRILYEVNLDGFSQLWLHELGGAPARQLDVAAGQACEPSRWFPTFSWFPDGARFALTVSTPTAPPNVLVGRAADGGLEQATRSWSAGLSPEHLAPAELIHYPTFDGRQIPAFVYQPGGGQPGDGRPSESRPAVFFVHGGPESQIRTAFNPIIQYLAHRGFVVVAPNVRGSSGYGLEYLHLDDVELRMDSVRDLAAGAEWVGRSGLADPRRIAVMGGSYGGFMVLAALTTYPELWAAGVDIVGIANFVTFLEQTGPWRRHLREAEYGSLEHHRAFLEEISPLNKADRIAAPLMVIHGANDPRVPVGEAEQIVANLRDRGRPVEYLRFEDEGHGLIKLRNRLVAYPRIGDFLEEHLAP